MTTPITEASNIITEDIDSATPLGIVNLLEKCDAEIFNGYESYPSLFHDEVINTIESIAGHVADALRCSSNVIGCRYVKTCHYEEPESSVVVFSGCGTSGRLGYVVSRSMNKLQAQHGGLPVFRYLLAGGDSALFTSQEAPEDDPTLGLERLKQVCIGKKTVVFVGITCGLSAPFVAGQLDYCLNNLDTFIPVLLGFNPTNMARNVKIESWDKTFLQVVQRMEYLRDQEGKNVYILNPIVGPEPITGSSRMKSGSATKIMLETFCLKAFNDKDNSTKGCVSDILRGYQKVYTDVYSHKEAISQVLEMAGHSLKAGGHLYYIGNDSLAAMGLIDSSECPPTYGASLDDVRGFIKSGYTTLCNMEGDITHLGKYYRISLDNFCDDIQLSSHDTVIVLNSEKTIEVPAKVLSSQCKKALITFQKVEYDGFDIAIDISLPVDLDDFRIPEQTCLQQMHREMATKWCLNAVSTGAHVMKGKVYKNIMIDVKVSNNKLFHRAEGILCKLGKINKTDATEFLLRSIYSTDKINDEIRRLPIANHIAMATPLDKVVPTALMMAVTGCSIREAKETISTMPVIRTAMMKILKNVK